MDFGTNLFKQLHWGNANTDCMFDILKLLFRCDNNGLRFFKKVIYKEWDFSRGTTDFGLDNSLLGIVRCLAASLPSTHQMPVAAP